MKKLLKKALQTHESASSSSQAKKNKKKGTIGYPMSAPSTQTETVKDTTFESPSAPPGVPGLASSSSMPDASYSTMNDPATALYRQSTFKHPRNPPPIPGGNKSKDKETSYPPTLPQSDMAGRSGTGTFETHWAPLAVSNTDPVDGAGLSDDQDRRSSHSRDIIYATDSFVFTDFIALEEVQQARSDGQMYDFGTEQDNFEPDDQAGYDEDDAQQQSLLASQTPPYVPSNSKKFRDKFERPLKSSGSRR